MNQFSTYQPTPATYKQHRKTWCCPDCGAELARVKIWPKETRLIVADDFIRDEQGTYQKLKPATRHRIGFRRWITTTQGRNYAAKLQAVIDRAEANARKWEAEAQAIGPVPEEDEEPNSPGVQARCCRQYAQIIRTTLDSLNRSEKLWLPEAPHQAARRELLEKLGVEPPTMEQREMRAAQAWTDPKEFTETQIREKPLKFFCCRHLRYIRRVRGIA